MTGVETGITSEVNHLQSLLVHAPHDGIARVLPTKSQQWLFEDILDLTVAREEYSLFIRVLMHFLDRDKAIELKDIADFSNPSALNFYRSDKVVDVIWLLADVLEDRTHRMELLSAICGMEYISNDVYEKLLNVAQSRELASILVSGCMTDVQSGKTELLFAPLPNLVMVRDLMVFVKDFLIIGRPCKAARRRETTIIYSLVRHHSLFEPFRSSNSVVMMTEQENMFLLDDEEQEQCRMTLEGGDILVVSPDHILIGVGERTSIYAAKRIMTILLKRRVVRKVSLIVMPKQRYCMHLDTVITQIRPDMWLLFDVMLPKGALTSTSWQLLKVNVQIVQYRYREDNDTVEECQQQLSDLRHLLRDISINELKCEDCHFVLCADGRFPNNWREQWTDGCNSLTLKDGVFFLFDRNRLTIKTFQEKHGFDVIAAKDLLDKLDKGTVDIDRMRNTIITLPSSELSRGRGGPHCMSLPMTRAV